MNPLPPPNYLLDGDYFLGIEVGRAAPVFPFRQNGDNRTLLITRRYDRRLLNYVRGTLGVDTDRFYKDAYLIDEPDPVATQDADLIRVEKTFSRIPSTQTIYSTLSLTKPSPSTLGTDTGDGLDYTASDSTPSQMGSAYSYLGYTWLNNVVYTQKAGTSSQTLPSGGTFTLTYKTSTTAALAYNESNANVAAAFNGLADVIADGITATVTNGLSTTGQLDLTLTVGSTASRITMAAGSLTPAAASTAFTTIRTSTNQVMDIARRVPITSHGFSGSASLLVDSGGTLYLLAATTAWTSIDSNNIAYNGEIAGSGTVFGQQYRTYTPGVDRVGCKIISTFYLPGITAGITTPADIPIPSPLLNDAEFLAEVVATLTGYVDYDAKELVKWRDGPIYQLDTIQINMADV